MSDDLLLNLYLHPPILQTALAGKSGFLNRVRTVLEPRGWRIQIQPSGEEARASALDRPAMRCSTWSVQPMIAR